MNPRQFDPRTVDPRTELGHNVRTCACASCCQARYWHQNPGIISPSFQAKIDARFTHPDNAFPLPESVARARDDQLLKVWGDVFYDIALSERIDTAIHYRGGL